jgi:hypothetical protein
MCDSGRNDHDPPEESRKRARGPSDCLDWEEEESNDDNTSDEDFIPFTQTPDDYEMPPPKKRSAKMARACIEKQCNEKGKLYLIFFLLFS